MQQQYEVNAAAVRVAIDALDYEYNHDARTQSPRLCADRLRVQYQEEQLTQGASFVATSHTKVRSKQKAASCWARMLG